SPLEYAMRSTARPANVPGVCSHLTSPVTLYLPLEHTVPAALHAVQLPPPVASLDVPRPPAGAMKVPVPVTVILELSLARADATPPGVAVGGVLKSRLPRSHRTC